MNYSITFTTLKWLGACVIQAEAQFHCFSVRLLISNPHHTTTESMTATDAQEQQQRVIETSTGTNGVSQSLALDE